MLPSHYDPTLVALSIFTAIGAGHAALSVAERITSLSGRFKRAWIIIGAFAMGSAIWSMHYLGMLAFRLPIEVRYNVPLVILSMLIAVASSAIALTITSRPTLTKIQLVLGSVCMGSGIAAMHYIGMAAIRASCTCVYSPWLVSLSVIIAVVVSGVALASLRIPSRLARIRRVGASIVLGIAICSMHYTGMAAVHFLPSPAPSDSAFALGVSWLGGVAIAGVSLLVLALSLLGTLADRYITGQTEKLESTEQRYQLLFERSLAGIYRSTLDGVIVDCNPAFINLLGFTSKAEVIGQSLDTQILTANSRETFVNSLLANGSVGSCETQVHCADGSLVWVIAAGTLMQSPGAPGEIQGMFLSIQELKRKEIELEAAKIQAETANETKSQFLSNMSHELRTPLIGVLGMAEIMESSEPTAEQREYLEIIRGSADSLLALISKILEFAGKSQPGPGGEEVFSLTELVTEEAESARVLAAKKGVALFLEDKLQDCPAYRADSSKLRLIVHALLDNAVKFTPQGEIVVTICRRGRAAKTEFVRLSVRDTGIGIPPAIHEAIFEPFNQADTSNSRRFGGAGIGLSLARESVRSLGGELLVDSATGQGSTFTVEVALAREDLVAPTQTQSVMRV